MQDFRPAVLLALLMLAAVWDVRTYRISNWLTGMGVLAAGTIRVATYGVTDIPHFLADLSLPIVLLSLLFLIRVLGAGDIKLFSMISGFLGFHQFISCMQIAFLIGALMAYIKMYRERTLFFRMRCLKEYAAECVQKRKILPYSHREPSGQMHVAPAIFLAYVFYLGVM